ncbi:hypothetical protein [Streptomyces antibioticus]|uniref:hypothetical protein n=1 Tax=Streptomyces antibioticus TaxID=1890 RepID=UPI0033AF6697
MTEVTPKASKTPEVSEAPKASEGRDVRDVEGRDVRDVERRDVRDVRNAPEALGKPDDLTETPAVASHKPPAAPHKPSAAPGALLPREEGDKLTARLEHAVVGFVDGPRDAVEEADAVLQELAARLTDAVQSRRRTLRGSWQPAAPAEGTSAEPAATPDTEQLRLALRDYRELTERLLHI